MAYSCQRLDQNPIEVNGHLSIDLIGFGSAEVNAFKGLVFLS